MLSVYKAETLSHYFNARLWFTKEILPNIQGTC